VELGLPNLVSIDFTDGTTLNFQLELDLKSRVELLTLKAGNITDVKRLRPASVVRRGRVPLLSCTSRMTSRQGQLNPEVLCRRRLGITFFASNNESVTKKRKSRGFDSP